MILGISGTNAAGKGEVVAYLEARSFYALSLSDVIRDELAARGEEPSRERMIEVGRAIREAEGAGALANRLLDRLQPDRNYVVDSVRHPAEVEVLRSRGRGFHLLWVDAPQALRFERLRARARPGDPETLEEFRRLESLELESESEAGQQLLAVRETADFRIQNEGALDALHESLRRVLERTQSFERPGWDEYFMSIARVVASRSNCVKRKIAAVIVKDRRIISTGYNGTPRGVTNCNEGGCPRCNRFGESGKDLGECLCSHGEENAIVQASYHGISLRDATVYITLSPCLLCSKMIINAGIREVVYNAAYPMKGVSIGLLREAGVKVRQLELPS